MWIDININLEHVINYDQRTPSFLLVIMILDMYKYAIQIDSVE